MNPDTYNQLIYEAGVYKQQLDLIQSELAKATKTLVEISGAKETLKATKDIENAKDVIIPIGGGVFMDGTMEMKKILLRVGGGYSVVVDRGVAISELEKRESAIKTLIDKFNKEAMKLSEQMDRVNLELSKYQRNTNQ